MKEFVKDLLASIATIMFNLAIALLMGLFFSWLTGIVIKTPVPVPYDWHRLAAFFLGATAYLYSIYHEDQFDKDMRYLEWADDLRQRELDYKNRKKMEEE